MISAPTASRLRRKRRSACCPWLRDLTVNSRSTGAAGGAVGASTCWGMVVMATSFLDGGRSAQPDAGVQHRVQQVRYEVEQHHEERGDDQPAQHDVEVLLP